MLKQAHLRLKVILSTADGGDLQFGDLIANGTKKAHELRLVETKFMRLCRIKTKAVPSESTNYHKMVSRLASPLSAFLLTTAPIDACWPDRGVRTLCCKAPIVSFNVTASMAMS